LSIAQLKKDLAEAAALLILQKKVPSVLGGKGAMIPLAEHSIWSLDAAQ
jgi:hypothetical protein